MPIPLGGGELILMLVLLALYFLPSLLAAARGTGSGTTVLLNLLLGWTVIGWLVLLLSVMTRRATGTRVKA